MSPCSACCELLAAVLRLLRKLVDGAGRLLRRGVARLKRAACGRSRAGSHDGGRRSFSCESDLVRREPGDDAGYHGYHGDDGDHDGERAIGRADDVLLKSPPPPGAARGDELSARELAAATKLLQSIEGGEGAGWLDDSCLQWLSALALSEKPGAQEPAALYFLHASRTTGCVLPEHSAPLLTALLRSEDGQVQGAACEALRNMLESGAVAAEPVLESDVGPALLDLLESGDSGLQVSACACLHTLLDTGPGCATELVGARVVASLLVLAKSYESRVQQGAVEAIHSLAQSDTGRAALHHEGALPVLVLLLQSGDPEVQHHSCAALTLLSAEAPSRAELLAMGDRFVVKSLLTLTSSSVEKVAVQACECCRVLATEEPAQLMLVAMDALPQLHGILGSGSSAERGAALSLLNRISSNPHLQAVMVEHGILQALSRVLAEERASSGAVVNAADTIANLGSASHDAQVLLSSQCVEVLLDLLGTLDATNQKEALIATLSSLAELCNHGAVRRRLLVDPTGRPVARLVELAAHCPHTPGRVHAMAVICHLAREESPSQMLGPHLPAIVSTLDDFLSQRNSDPHLLRVALRTLTRLTRDPAVMTMVQSSPLGRSLYSLHAEVEETRCLLRQSIGCSSSSSGSGSDNSRSRTSSPEPHESVDPFSPPLSPLPPLHPPHAGTSQPPGHREPSPAPGGTAHGASERPRDGHGSVHDGDDDGDDDDDDVDFDVIADPVRDDKGAGGDHGDDVDGDDEGRAWTIISHDDCTV